MFENGCPNCHKKWKSRVKEPVKCSRCQFRLDLHRKENSDGNN